MDEANIARTLALAYLIKEINHIIFQITLEIRDYEILHLPSDATPRRFVSLTLLLRGR
jgi:hypothetical protein